MDGEQHPSKVALRQAREQTLDNLSDAFVRDVIGLEDFERRVDAAHQASDVESLERLLGDLTPDLKLRIEQSAAPEPQPTQPVSQPQSRSQPQSQLQSQPRKSGHSTQPSAALALPARPQARAMAIFGSTERHGRFVLADGTQVIAVFGNVELDLREAELQAPVTYLFVRSVFGSVQITVPPRMAVDCDGSGVMGSFSGIHRIPSDPDAAPVLRIVGVAVFGSVEVRTRPPRKLRRLLGKGY